ncbi:MAG TPA: FkbM family methyltransferase [Chthonomonadales bacterium]|nr:FkbM family methyltransferase [Chthonomonadales bacterium]
MGILRSIGTCAALVRREGLRGWGRALRRLPQLPRFLRWHALPPGSEVECLLEGRLRMRLSAADNSIARRIFTTGAFEPRLLAFMRASVTPGAVAVDVGANVGVHTLTLAESVGPGGSVHAFEPSAAYDRLTANLRLNGLDGRVRANRAAVGAAPGSLALRECEQGYEAFTSAGRPLAHAKVTGATFDVPMVTLDRYLEEHGVSSVDFLKVDVEGYEVEVLRGARGLLGRRAVRRIMLEVSDPLLEGCGASAGEMFELLHAAGYSTCLLDAATGKLEACPAPRATVDSTLVAMAP